ncbi:meiosis 1 arrest protein isoform X2 [Tyto alba]|uniref:meiosis 1 arrest protein isoform X2 n=1 Tax=Tyto alba TaxID=56313 RepID=UPI001C66FB37|nr:meiosis 1 arrest protein isoform X2 [Tyto alba]
MNSRKLLSEAQRTFPSTKVHCQQPSRILIVDVTSPSWTNTCSVLCEALENTLCLVCSLIGPCRVPLLSLYVVQNQQECLLPFTITILTSQSSKEMAKHLENKLKDVDLVSLRRLQVIEVLKRDFLEPEDVEQHMPAEEPSSNDIAILGMDIDVQTIEDNVISLEMLFKTWLHDYGTEREHLHLLLPSGGFSHATAPKTPPMCLKCDLQERLLDPALLSGMVDGTLRADLNSPCQMAAWPATVLYKLRVVKALKSEGVCESVLYGLPFIIKPTSCWQLDWDDLEINQHSFHALCHSLLKRKWMLLAKREPQNTSPNWNIMVHSYYIIVPSDSASLLVKAVAIRELLLPSTFPALLGEHPESVHGPIESALNRLEVEVAYNPLHIKSNLYKYLKSMLYKPLHWQQAQPRDQRPERHQPKQVCLLPLTSLDILCSALLVCFLQKG